MQLKLPAATFNRSTSMRSFAFRSDCNKRRPMLVFVVAENTLNYLRTGISCGMRHGRG